MRGVPQPEMNAPVDLGQVRDAAVDHGSLLPTERRRLHQAWAEALSARGSSTAGSASYLVELAHHWREAHDPRALEASVRAGDRAMQSYSFEVATREYEAALLLWSAAAAAASGLDHVDVLVNLGRAAYYCKRDREAVSAYREALEEAGDETRRSLIYGRLARSLWAMGEWASASEAYEMAHNVARSAIRDYQLSDGHFVTRVYRGGLRHTLPFLRWPQAQMFYALTNLMVSSTKVEKSARPGWFDKLTTGRRGPKSETNSKFEFGKS